MEASESSSQHYDAPGDKTVEIQVSGKATFRKSGQLTLRDFATLGFDTGAEYQASHGEQYRIPPCWRLRNQFVGHYRQSKFDAYRNHYICQIDYTLRCITEHEIYHRHHYTNQVAREPWDLEWRSIWERLD